MSELDTPPGAALNRPRTSRWIRRWFGSRALLVVVLLVCIGTPALVVTRTVALFPPLSPYDEIQHLDYTTRLSRGELPRLGDRLTQRQLRLLACTGVGIDRKPAPRCNDRRFDADDFSAGGYQYEAHQPPLYYASTTGLRFVTGRVLGIHDELEATRLIGIAWLAAGLLALWVAGRLFRVPPWTMAAILLIVALSPLPAYLSSTVTNDAASILAGALALCLAGVARRRPDARWIPWLLLGGGAVAALFKSTNVIALVAVALLLLWEAWRARPTDATWRETLRPWWRTGGALLLGGSLAVVVWALVVRSLAVVDPYDIPIYASVLHVDGLPVGQLWEELGLILGPLSDSTTPPFLWNEGQQVYLHLVKGLLLAAALAWVFVRPREWPHILGAAALVSMLAVSFALGIAFYISYQADPALSGRYVLSAAPVLALALAGAAKGRAPAVALWAIAGSYLVIETAALV